MRQAEEIIPLQPFHPCQELGVAEKGARLLEGQQVAVEILDHLIGIAPGQLVDAGEIGDIRVVEFEESLAVRQLLLVCAISVPAVPEPSIFPSSAAA